MKMIQQRALLAYEAPEAEEILVRIEENIMSVIASQNGGSTPDDLTEEDYSGIWNN